MESQRLFLFLVFFLSLAWLWQAWQQEHGPRPAPAVAQQAPNPENVPAPTSGEAPARTLAGSPLETAAKLVAGATLMVETDYLRAEISTVGGDIRRLELLKQRDTDDPNRNFVLLESEADHIYVAQSGFTATSGLPSHKTVFSAAPGPYTLNPGADQIEVRLTAPAQNGVKVTKVLVFRRSSYVIEIRYEIENSGAAAVSPDAYFQLVRDGKLPGGETKMVPNFTGPAIYTEKDKFHKIKFEDIDKDKADYPRKAGDGWIAMLQHYFLTAWLPPANSEREFYVNRNSSTGLYAAGVVLSAPAGTIAPGKSGVFAVSLYAGPQEQDQLKALAPGLDLTVDYGWLRVIAVPLFWLLSHIEEWVANWGVAIIVLTVLIKLLFYPFSAASYRSMARMRALQPKLQRLKEQYGNDRERMNAAMMELYKTEKLNPLGGCLPTVVQIPVFIALYWVLLASVELRHAPFVWWIHDLSAKDPYYILPIVMTLTMVVQTRLNPTPPDPVQARVMLIMPFMFSVFFFFFPAGLVLYWLVNNILSIAQQWVITRSAEHESAHGKR